MGYAKLTGLNWEHAVAIFSSLLEANEWRTLVLGKGLTQNFIYHNKYPALGEDNHK